MDNDLKEKIVEVVNAASCIVLIREGDVSTEDGDFATCPIGDIIDLEGALVSLLNLPSDDVTLDVFKYIGILEEKL